MPEQIPISQNNMPGVPRPKASLANIWFVILLALLLLASLGANGYQYTLAGKEKVSLKSFEADLKVKTDKLNEQDAEMKGLQTSVDDLKTQKRDLTDKVSSLNSKAIQYLALQKQACDQDAESCLDAIFKVTLTKPLSYTSKGGLCIIRDAYTNMPSESSADNGKGYAKMTKDNVNTIQTLQEACTQDDYTELLQVYCQSNTNPVQMSVAVVNKLGGVESSACSKLGCGFVSCPPGQ